jgi:hypothetical protein
MRIMTMAAAGAGLLALSAHPLPAGAQTALPDAVARVQAGEGLTSYAQYYPRRYYAGPSRHYYGGPRYYGHRYYGHRYYGYPYGYYRRDRGGAVAAGVAGLAAGALIGSAIASQQAQAAAPAYVVPNQSAAYCAQRFRSYDPASGTYVGYDGRRRPCP